MVYLSATVVHGSGGRVLVPWEIVQCHSEAITIHDFFITLLLLRLALSEYGGVEVFVLLTCLITCEEEMRPQ